MNLDHVDFSFQLSIETTERLIRLLKITENQKLVEVVKNSLQIYDEIIDWHVAGNEIFARDPVTRQDELCPLPGKKSFEQVKSIQNLIIGSFIKKCPAKFQITLPRRADKRLQKLAWKSETSSKTIVIENALYMYEMFINWDNAGKEFYRRDKKTGQEVRFYPFTPSDPSPDGGGEPANDYEPGPQIVKIGDNKVKKLDH